MPFFDEPTERVIELVAVLCDALADEPASTSRRALKEIGSCLATWLDDGIDNADAAAELERIARAVPAMKDVLRDTVPPPPEADDNRE